MIYFQAKDLWPWVEVLVRKLRYVCCLLNQDALLIRPESEALMRSICERERVSMAVIGKIRSAYRAPSMFGFWRARPLGMLWYSWHEVVHWCDASSHDCFFALSTPVETTSEFGCKRGLLIMTCQAVQNFDQWYSLFALQWRWAGSFGRQCSDKGGYCSWCLSSYACC